MSTHHTPEVKAPGGPPVSVPETTAALCRWAEAAAPGSAASSALPSDALPEEKTLISVWLLSASLEPASRPAREDPHSPVVLRYVLTAWHTDSAAAQTALHGLLAAAARLPAGAPGIRLRALPETAPDTFWLGLRRAPSACLMLEARFPLPLPTVPPAPPVRAVVQRLSPDMSGSASASES